MKKSTILLLFLFYFSSNSFCNDLKDAEKAYDSKNFKISIQHYQKLINEGYKSYQLYFNLGNSYYRNNELGKAIYYYELASKSNPTDDDIKINLAIATSKTIDKVNSKENFFITAIKTNILSSFSTFTWSVFTISFICLASLLFFIFINSNNILIKRISFVGTCFCFILFTLSYFLGYTSLKSKSENKFAIITSKEIKILNEPTISGTAKFNLHEGTKIRVVENKGEWILIKLDNGNEGWIKTTDVGII
jgi:tetratricopeptide (TPR) repeat protein